MVISELQIALIGAGAAAVAAVWGYNAWQDRRHRKAADRIFNAEQGDALLPESREPAIDERQEPRFADEVDDPLEPLAEEQIAEPEVASRVEPIESEPIAASEPKPELPVEWADDVADCVLRLVTAEPVSAPAVWVMQEAWAAGIGKPLRWLAHDEANDRWQRVDANDAGRYRDWAVALQLADRRGPVSDGELSRFFEGVQQIARKIEAPLELPAREEIILHAERLDQFCAELDIQFVLHVVEAQGGVFSGTKLRGVAEAAGLVLEADGVFRARDSAGGELFTLANLGTERLDANSIKSLATNGLTLSLDVPRVAHGTLAFDRMLATARTLATSLGGALVDAQRAPLAEAMIAAIRAKTAELQQRMRDDGIVPGSTRALRLFS